MGELHVAPSAARADRRDEVAARCPYCREDLRLDEGAWTACALCLARHHTGCWDEHGRCSSCGDASRLAPIAPPAERIPGLLGVAARAVDLIHRLVGIGLGGVGVAVAIPATIGLVVGPGASRPPALLALGVAALLLTAGLGLRAASMRWAARPRRLPAALLALDLALGLTVVGLLWLVPDPKAVTVAGLALGSTLAWTLLTALLAWFGARRLEAAEPQPATRA